MGIQIGEMKIYILALLMLATMIQSSWGQVRKPKTLDELVAYTGADRHQILVEGAKAEGKIAPENRFTRTRELIGERREIDIRAADDNDTRHRPI